MECFDDIQIEDALCGQPDVAVTAHLATCPRCRGRLAEAQSIRAQLRSAFAGAHISDELTDRIRRATIGDSCATGGLPASANPCATGGLSASANPCATGSLSASAKPRPHRGSWLLHHWVRFAVAAGLMLGATLLLVWQLHEPSPASAAQELVRLHEQNLSGQAAMMTHASPDQDAAYLSGQLGYKVAVPRDQGELRMKGCCVAKFLGRQAGNMVIQGPHGPISLIVSDVNERDLMTPRKIVKDGHTFWICPMKGFHTVAVQHGGLIYCAVGDETPDHLVGLLNDILKHQ